MGSKEVQDLKPDDRLDLAGVVCVVEKVASIFHYSPNADIRVALRIRGSSGRYAKAVIFLPRGIDVTTLDNEETNDGRQ